MTSIDVSTLSRMVTRLARLGLVTRTRSRKSDREIVVTLTPKGRTMLTRLIPTARRFEQAAIDWLAVQLNDSANSAHSVCSESLVSSARQNGR